MPDWLIPTSLKELKMKMNLNAGAIDSIPKLHLFAAKTKLGKTIVISSNLFATLLLLSSSLLL
jgi:hypothetical protein